jgi:hypothetical protein
MKIDGKCHCGEIAYQAEADNPLVRVCHCTDCQTVAGSAFRVSVTVPSKDFRLLRGEPKRYIKIAESGNKRLQVFCGTCGTGLYASEVENPPIIALRLGAIAQRAAFVPQLQIWRRSALPWVDSVGEVPARDGQ